jgi:hypothetical protein
MRLVEVTGLVHGLKDRYPVAQQGGRVAGAFDLTEQPVRHTRSGPEVTLHRADGERLSVIAYRGLHHIVPRNHATPSEPVDIAFGVFEVRQRPAEPLEFERSVGRYREIYIAVID